MKKEQIYSLSHNDVNTAAVKSRMTGSLFSKTHIAENTTTIKNSLLIYSHSFLLLSYRSVFKQPFVHWMCIEQNKLDEKKED
jgi:hypothetical protein